MPGEKTDVVAVESATTAVAAATAAQDAASAAQNAVAEVTEAAQVVENETVVVASEAAVALAEATAASATIQAAVATQEAAAAIEQHAQVESWQDEAIRNLQTQNQELASALSAMAGQLQGTQNALTELVTSLNPASLQSTPPTSATETTTPPTENPETVTAQNSTGTEASPASGAENPAQKTAEAKKRRILRFL